MAKQREAIATLEKQGAAGQSQITQVREEKAALEAELQKQAAEHQAVAQAHAETRVKLAEFVALSDQRQDSIGKLEKRLEIALEERERRNEEIAALRHEIHNRTSGAQIALQTSELAQFKLNEFEAAAALQQEANLRLEQELAAANRKFSEAEKIIGALKAEVQSRTADHETARQAHSLAQLRLTEYESSSTQQRATIDWLEKNLASVRQQHDEVQRRISSLESDLAAVSAELQSSKRARADAETGLAEIRDRLTETETALRRSQQDRDSYFGSKVAAEKIIEGLKEHIVLLLADYDQKQAQHARLEAASRQLLAHKDQALASVREMAEARAKIEAAHIAAAARLEVHAQEAASLRADYDKVRSDLRERIAEIEILNGAKREAEKARFDLEQSRATHAAQLQALTGEMEKAHSDKTRLEVQLNERFDEIATLTKLLAEVESAPKGGDGSTDELRNSAAKEIGRVIAALLDAQDWNFLPNPIRVRQQMSLLERSGIFDREWYVRQYEDIALAGVDPLRHYVVFGAREGREPNAALSYQIASRKMKR